MSDEANLLGQVRLWAEPRCAELKTPAGERHLDHALGTADILREIQADTVTQAAALLIGLPESAGSEQHEEISRLFGPEVASLVQGTKALLRLGTIVSAADSAGIERGGQNEMLRKMLLAMAADLRIVLIRLASRLQTLRWHALTKIPCDPAMAHETLNLYAPLANRLGIWQLKWQLEDLAFRFTDPQRYKEIARLLEEKRVERELFIEQTIERITLALSGLGVKAEVSGRPKHIYSIYNLSLIHI